MKALAPWPDWAGNEIHDGDTIEHPDGERGVVEFWSRESRPEDQWRVRYRLGISRLVLQVGEKGLARIVVPPKGMRKISVFVDNQWGGAISGYDCEHAGVRVSALGYFHDFQAAKRDAHEKLAALGVHVDVADMICRYDGLTMS